MQQYRLHGDEGLTYSTVLSILQYDRAQCQVRLLLTKMYGLQGGLLSGAEFHPGQLCCGRQCFGLCNVVQDLLVIVLRRGNMQKESWAWSWVLPIVLMLGGTPQARRAARSARPCDRFGSCESSDMKWLQFGSFYGRHLQWCFHEVDVNIAMDDRTS